jgi:hypothetical protein
MSTGAHEWDVVVPEDGSALLENLRQHGVRPGQRLHLQSVPDSPDPLLEEFIGSGGDSGDPDLSSNAKQIARDEMGEWSSLTQESS